VEDVDLSKVLTANHVMKRAEAVNIDKGPRVALKMMKELGISSIYVVNKRKTLLGAITADQAKQAVEQGQSIHDILIDSIDTVIGETLLTDLFDTVSQATIPVAVVDEANRLKGIVVRGAVLGALAGNNENINNTELLESQKVEVTN